MSKLEYKRNQETQKGIGTQGSEDEKAVGVAWGGGHVNRSPKRARIMAHPTGASDVLICAQFLYRPNVYTQQMVSAQATLCKHMRVSQF